MKTVLIISDDQELAAALKAALWSDQFNLTVLASHEHVLEELIQLKPAMILVDFLLNNTNGGSLCHEIRACHELNQLPLILITDYPNVERFTGKFGCNAIIRKPIRVQELIDVIGAMLNDPAITPHRLHRAS